MKCVRNATIEHVVELLFECRDSGSANDAQNDEYTFVVFCWDHIYYTILSGR